MIWGDEIWGLQFCREEGALVKERGDREGRAHGRSDMENISPKPNWEKREGLIFVSF